MLNYFMFLNEPDTVGLTVFDSVHRACYAITVYTIEAFNVEMQSLSDITKEDHLPVPGGYYLAAYVVQPFRADYSCARVLCSSVLFL